MAFVNGEHQTEVRVRYSETDRMGIAYNSHFLVWFEIGRTELLRDLGLAYRELERRGFMLPLRETGVKYLKPVLYDDVLTIVTWFGNVTGARVRMDYEIRRSGETLATGFTEHVFTDASLRPVRPPKDVVELMNSARCESIFAEDESE
jgi:acyl-CoA thioester hydrolase